MVESSGNILWVTVCIMVGEVRCVSGKEKKAQDSLLWCPRAADHSVRHKALRPTVGEEVQEQCCHLVAHSSMVQFVIQEF